MTAGKERPTPIPFQAVLFGPRIPLWTSADWEDLRARRVLSVPAAVPYLLAHHLIPEAICGPPTACTPSVRRQLRAWRVRFLPGSAATPWEALALGLNYAITTGVRDIWLLGIGGNSLADTLAHISLLARPEWGGAHLTIIHGQEKGHLLRHGETAILHGQPGDQVLLVPLSPSVTEVTSQGLAPEHHGQELTFGEPALAHLTAHVGRVWIRAGRLLVAHTRTQT